MDQYRGKSISKLIDEIEYEYRQNMDLCDIIKEGLIIILIRLKEINKNGKHN